MLKHTAKSHPQLDDILLTRPNLLQRVNHRDAAVVAIGSREQVEGPVADSQSASSLSCNLVSRN